MPSSASDSESSLAPVAREHLTLDQVRAALERPLPGPQVQWLMAPRPRTTGPGNGQGRSPRESAVLLLLYPCGGELCLVLTKRTDTVGHHKGQVSLPGGAREPGDASLVVTAVRETEEELGVSLRRVKILGSLTNLLTGSSNYLISPFVGAMPGQPTFFPNPAEVAQVIEVPLRALVDPGLRREETWTIHDAKVAVPHFVLQGHKVWGATAMILSEFAEVLSTSDGDARDAKAARPSDHPPIK